MKQKIIFYQQFPLPYFGILSISGYLEKYGFYPDVIVSFLEDDPVEAVSKLEPDVIGISVMSVEHKWLINTAQKIRRVLPNAKIVVGGIHAVLYPEEILSIPQVDLVCTSDGEEVMLDILRELEKSEPDWHSIKGIGFRDKVGKLHLTERAPLFAYKKEIIEDRRVYFKRYPLLARDTAQRFISSRGCPYHCSFCYNERLRKIFEGRGQYIRRKEVTNLIKEIALVCQNSKVDAVFFMDDLFTMDKEWLRKFLSLYKNEVGIPFVCTTRANIIDEERAALLADAGCRTVSFGVESGNYEIRKFVLNKDLTDKSIINCGRLLKKYGLKTQTTNMFCLPGETLQNAYETIELNIKAGTDFAFASLLMPFPKTTIADYCIEHGFIKSDYSLNDLPESFMTQSILNIKEKELIVNVQRLSYFFVRSPWLYRNFKWVVRFKRLKKLFGLLFELSNFLRHKGERGISFISAFRYAWRMRETF